MPISASQSAEPHFSKTVLQLWSCTVFFFNVTQILSLYILWQVWNDAATQVLLPVPTLFFL